MKKLSLILIGLVLFGCQPQITVNKGLKKQLDSILFQDQILREYTTNHISPLRKQEILKLVGYSQSYLDKNIWSIISKTDSLNLRKVESIIQEYGYPGKSLVGEPTNNAAFLVIQHSPKIAHYFPMIEEAGKKNEIAFSQVAMMLDRKLTQEGKPQIYGTQIEGRTIVNKETGKTRQVMYVLPIKDPARVNSRRKKAGFNLTVEENARRFGIEYRPYTYEEIAEME